MVAGVPRHGGATWAVLQYVLGLRELGWDVWLVEPVETMTDERTRYFDDVVERFGLAGRSALLRTDSSETHGVGHGELVRAAAGADLLLNVSGMLADTALLDPIAARVYLDLDPVFNQLWHLRGDADIRFAAHTHFATVGLLLGRQGCAAPSLGLDWIPTLPPVVLREWPVSVDARRGAFTTVANWRSYGVIEHDGRLYGQKAHSFRELVELPRRTGASFEIALGIDPGDAADESTLRTNGWGLLDPGESVGTPDLYAEFIRRSLAEIGVAKSGYVLGRSGWFSDRAACYLASGKPVLAQDTGFAGHVPVGEGLLSFASVDDAVAGVELIVSDYRRHAAAARELASTYLAAEIVLGRLLDRIFDGRHD